MAKVLFGFLLGVVWLGYCVSLKKPQVIEVSPDALAATQGQKEIVRREIQLRFYADDGSYMLATDTQYIDGNVGDEVSSSQWRTK